MEKGEAKIAVWTGPIGTITVNSSSWDTRNIKLHPFLYILPLFYPLLSDSNVYNI